ncbi:MAG: hypothetical protein H7Y43_01980 [Akkermansiaceae bacterium]|nr:hypothetical protein [Verrucomicrobiales bacterium]
MTLTNVARRRRPSGKFLTAIGFVFILQVALLLWSGGGTTIVQLKPVVKPAYQLGEARAPELAALEDPTLFVLPHEWGFSGDAWMKMPRLTFEPQPWSSTEPLRWLLTNPEELGETLNQYVEAHPAPAFPVTLMPEPALTYPRLAPTLRLWPSSTLRIEGGLAQRRFLNSPQLPFVTEALTNSVVEVLVDPHGETFTAVLVSRSGSTNNLDDLALKIAKASRFESIEPIGPDRASAPEPKLVQGTLIFEWQPQPPTNSRPVLP